MSRKSVLTLFNCQSLYHLLSLVITSFSFIIADNLIDPIKIVVYGNENVYLHNYHGRITTFYFKDGGRDVD